MKDHLASELCYEEYQNVAVMFATIRNYDTEQVGMRVLNEIICDFDEVVRIEIFIKKLSTTLLLLLIFWRLAKHLSRLQ